MDPALQEISNQQILVASLAQRRGRERDEHVPQATTRIESKDLAVGAGRLLRVRRLDVRQTQGIRLVLEVEISRHDHQGGLGPIAL